MVGFIAGGKILFPEQVPGAAKGRDHGCAAARTCSRMKWQRRYIKIQQGELIAIPRGNRMVHKGFRQLTGAVPCRTGGFLKSGVYWFYELSRDFRRNFRAIAP